MAEPERHLRAVKGTGEVSDAYAELSADYLGLVEQLRKVIREKGALQAQLTRIYKVDPQVEKIEECLTYWKNKCHGPASSVKIPIDGARATAARKMLKQLIEADKETRPELASTDKEIRAAALADAEDRAVERIKGAIDGAAAFPFEGKYAKRHAEQVPGSKRKVDLVYILRDEVKMEQFERLHEGDERRLAYRADLHRRLTTQPNLRAVLASLDPDYGEILARAIRWCQQETRT